ncbi:MAG: hypothetical protein JWQ97_2725 [Phenylobacterium sp.]|nr:hypothetical protein [Phenylobacterium sp.]
MTPPGFVIRSSRFPPSEAADRLRGSVVGHRTSLDAMTAALGTVAAEAIGRKARSDA